MNKPFWQLISIQFKEYWREPEVLFWTLAFPVIMAWTLGVTFLNKPVMNYKVAWVQTQDGKPRQLYFPEESMEIQLEGRNFVEKIQILEMSLEEAQKGLKNGSILLILRSDGEKLSYGFDPANEEATKIYLWLEKRAFGEKSPSRVEPLKGKGTRYIDYLIPGLIALGIMNSTIWGIGWTLIEFRIKKFMRRMLATPMKKAEFMASLSVTRMSLGLIEAGILFVFVYFVFNIRMEGSFGAVLFLFFSGHVAFNGIAVFLASRTESSRAGNTIINIVTLPFFLLSGVFFSYQNFPDWIVSIVKVLPLTVLADSMRNLFLTPAGFSEIIFPAAYLLALGGVFYTVGIRIYKWY